MELAYPKDKMRVILLEGIHKRAEELFSQAGYTNIEVFDSALEDSELRELVSDAHILGIRSKTQVRAETLAQAKNLLAIGCFCIGTDQVDLQNASQGGIPVFNAPFSNTRSVAELAMADIVMLARKAAWRSQRLHSGFWEKSAKGCHEVRGKKLGIIGYGHIGPQLGLLAESFGMQCFYYDIATKLPLGNATSLGSLDELLSTVDFVSLHVPDTPQTRRMIGERELSLMKKGSYLLNLSRGLVVDVDALAEALKTGHLSGAAADVFPSEPRGNGPGFESPLCNLENVILTPHIGAATEEAQANIGSEVAESLIRFCDEGSTAFAVNFPRVDMPMNKSYHRVLNIHKNVPGVLGEINGILAGMNVNIGGQQLGTLDEIGYLVMDVGENVSREVKKRIDALPAVIRTRLLF